MGWARPGLELFNSVPNIGPACLGLSNPGPKLNDTMSNPVSCGPGLRQGRARAYHDLEYKLTKFIQLYSPQLLLVK